MRAARRVAALDLTRPAGAGRGECSALLPRGTEAGPRGRDANLNGNLAVVARLALVAGDLVCDGESTCLPGLAAYERDQQQEKVWVRSRVPVPAAALEAQSVLTLFLCPGWSFCFHPFSFSFFPCWNHCFRGTFFLETQYKDADAHKHTYTLIPMNTRTQPHIHTHPYEYTHATLCHGWSFCFHHFSSSFCPCWNHFFRGTFF